MKKSKFPWYPPPTHAQLGRKYEADRFKRPGARSKLPEDTIDSRKPK